VRWIVRRFFGTALGTCRRAVVTRFLTGLAFTDLTDFTDLYDGALVDMGSAT